MLMFNGLRVYKSNFIINSINILMRLISLSTSIALLIYNIRALHSSIILKISWSAYYVYAILQTLLIVRRTTAIRTLSEDMINTISFRNYKHLTRFVRKIFFLYILSTIHSLGVSCVYFSKTSPKVTHVSNLLMISEENVNEFLIMFTFIAFYIPIICRAWLSPIMLIYSFFVYSIYLTEKSFLEDFNNELVSNSKSLNLLSVALSRKLRLNELKSQAESVLNIFPFLWCAYLFKSTSAYIMQQAQSVSTSTADMILSLILFSDYIVPMCFLFGLLLFIENRSDKIKDMSTSTLRRLVKTYHPDIESKTHLIQQFEHNAHLPLTGWSMFDLNKRFMLSFVSSVLSFSVLILQIDAKV